MKTLSLILEKGQDGWYGRVEGIKDYMPVGFGQTIAAVEKSIRELIKDHQMHDTPDGWQKVKADTVLFKAFYDLSALFEKFDVLKISSVARVAGMNPSLLRQYASQKKYPGKAQAKRIEDAIRKIAGELSEVSVYA